MHRTLLCALSALTLVSCRGSSRPEPTAVPPALRAARLAARAFDVVREERARLGLDIDARLDPGRSGLIGWRSSPVTTVRGSLAAKRASINPQWAARIVGWLQEAGVKPGDRVAAGLSGSFPALNIATLAALQALGTRPVVIASCGASQYGANLPGLLWPDMERVLLKSGVLQVRSVAMSKGGREDRGLELTSEGRRLLRAAIRRHGAALLEAPTLRGAIKRRMDLFEAGGAPKAYVNVGGGAASVGTRQVKRAFRPGLNRRLPPGAAGTDAVMTRFVRRGVPVLHLSRITRLARRHGLRVGP